MSTCGVPWCIPCRTALVATFPVLALAALAIKLTSPGPILFIQERSGLNKRPFRMYKLSTIVLNGEAQQSQLEAQNEATGPVFKIREDPPIAPVGRILRRFLMDELPQLVNVLRRHVSRGFPGHCPSGTWASSRNPPSCVASVYVPAAQKTPTTVGVARGSNVSIARSS
jgi:hypothetical protein